ncbi:MAG TPA: threonine/serine dehydratase [Candidatus Limnocylindria bacterium]|nr:threonine/serine dehydratase [Candidatus Limnocylindria bacterium]
MPRSALEDPLSVSLADVERARSVIAPHIARTPLLTSRSLGERIGARAFLKAENLQRTGSFKPRGAVNAIFGLSPEQRSKGIVTMSAGNAAQAIAFAGRAVGAKVTVAMPQSAPRTKVEATRGYGAEIVFAPDMLGLRALVTQIQERDGCHFLHPYDDDAMIAGHGTAALEVLDDLPEADVFVVGVGGGGLISGIAVAVAGKRPGARVIGVEPEGASAVRRALDAGAPVPMERIQTIADGLAAPIAGTRNLAIIRRLVADVVLVSDDVILEGVRFLSARARLVAEPAGGAAVGALLAGRIPVKSGENVVAIVSGGNVDLSRLAEFFTE